jgi:hypothetical protein
MVIGAGADDRAAGRRVAVRDGRWAVPGVGNAVASPSARVKNAMRDMEISFKGLTAG